MTLEDKIVKATQIIAKALKEDLRLTAFKSELHEINFEKTYNHFNFFGTNEHTFFGLKGESLITGVVVEHEFTDDLCLYVSHFYGGDSNGVRLLRDIEKWAKSKGAKIVFINTYYTSNPTLLEFFEKKGYNHCGYSFTKYL